MGLLLLLHKHYGCTRRYWHHHSVFCPQVERMAHIWLIVFYPWQWPTASLTRSFPFRTIEAGVKLPSMKCHKNRFGRKRPRWGNDSQGACQMLVDINSILIQALFLLFSHIQPVWQTRFLVKKAAVVGRNVRMTTNTAQVRCKMYCTYGFHRNTYSSLVVRCQISDKHTASIFRAEVMQTVWP